MCTGTATNVIRQGPAMHVVDLLSITIHHHTPWRAHQGPSSGRGTSGRCCASPGGRSGWLVSLTMPRRHGSRLTISRLRSPGQHILGIQGRPALPAQPPHRKVPPLHPLRRRQCVARLDAVVAPHALRAALAAGTTPGAATPGQHEGARCTRRCALGREAECS